MNKSLLTATLATAFLAGCSSTNFTSKNNSEHIPSGVQTAISEQRATQDFKRQGIKIEYSFFGRSIDALEVTGYAPVFGNSPAAVENAYRVAELDAKKKLNDFINKESIQSSTSVNIITRNLEKSVDNKKNNIGNNLQQVSTSDAEVGNGNSDVNTALRQDALKIATNLSYTTRQQSRGILGGLRMIENGTINDGRNVMVVYRWEKKLNNDVVDVRRAMMK